MVLLWLPPYALYRVAFICSALTPSALAVSRRIRIFTCGLLSSRLLLTSCSPATAASSGSNRVDASSSASTSGPCSTYWYRPLPLRLPMRIAGGFWKNTCISRTSATALRNCCKISSALAVRSCCGFKRMNMRPMLLPRVPPPPWPALDIAAHEHDCDEHGDQRQGHRHHGETEHQTADERGLHARHASFTMAHDVF